MNEAKKVVVIMRMTSMEESSFMDLTSVYRMISTPFMRRISRTRRMDLQDGMSGGNEEVGNDGRKE